MSHTEQLIAAVVTLCLAIPAAIAAVWGYVTGRMRDADKAYKEAVAAETAEYKRQIAKLEARLEDRDATIKGLGAKRDEDRQIADERVEAERAKTFRVAELMIRSSTVEQIQAIDEDDLDDVPTMLHRAIVVSKAAVSVPKLPESEEQRLRRYKDDERLTTPPEGYRAKQPSKHGR